jgi:hypothetical protein
LQIVKIEAYILTFKNHPTSLPFLLEVHQEMVTALLAFLTSSLCMFCLIIIEFFHMEHMKQENGIVFLKAVDALVDTFDSNPEPTDDMV